MPVGIGRTFRDLNVLECLGKYFHYTQTFYYIVFPKNFNSKISSHNIKKLTNRNMLNGQSKSLFTLIKSKTLAFCNATQVQCFFY